MAISKSKVRLYLAVALNHHLRANLNLLHHHHHHHRWRLLHNGPDTIEELLDRHVVKKEKTYKDDEENELLTRQRLTSTRREVLSLYRDIVRATRFFMWPDSRGVLWRDVLRENARKEFEEARFEKDPEIITRLLIGGRDAVQSALEKLAEKQRQQISKRDGDQDRR
uniref:Complex 1 LYR protein domain-containing protein n=1 Tax=Davidia involucrata TaxID=16924 RepID=A0A5B7CCK3_DAVIN